MIREGMADDDEDDIFVDQVSDSNFEPENQALLATQSQRQLMAKPRPLPPPPKLRPSKTSFRIPTTPRDPSRGVTGFPEPPVPPKDILSANHFYFCVSSLGQFFYARMTPTTTLRKIVLLVHPYEADRPMFSRGLLYLNGYPLRLSETPQYYNLPLGTEVQLFLTPDVVPEEEEARGSLELEEAEARTNLVNSVLGTPRIMTVISLNPLAGESHRQFWRDRILPSVGSSAAWRGSLQLRGESVLMADLAYFHPVREFLEDLLTPTVAGETEPEFSVTGFFSLVNSNLQSGKPFVVRGTATPHQLHWPFKPIATRLKDIQSQYAPSQDLLSELLHTVAIHLHLNLVLPEDHTIQPEGLHYQAGGLSYADAQQSCTDAESVGGMNSFLLNEPRQGMRKEAHLPSSTPPLRSASWHPSGVQAFQGYRNSQLPYFRFLYSLGISIPAATAMTMEAAMRREPETLTEFLTLCHLVLGHNSTVEEVEFLCRRIVSRLYLIDA